VGGVGGWVGGQIVVPRPSAAASLTGRRQKSRLVLPTLLENKLTERNGFKCLKPGLALLEWTGMKEVDFENQWRIILRFEQEHGYGPTLFPFYHFVDHYFAFCIVSRVFAARPRILPVKNSLNN
jgi:hypothetical protein